MQAASAENHGLAANVLPMALDGAAAAIAAGQAVPPAALPVAKPAPAAARAVGGKRKACSGRRSRQADSDTEEEDWWVAVCFVLRAVCWR